MEEILELKQLLLKGDIQGSLAIVEELEEMSKNDIINNIRSQVVILLLDLIKQQAENRTTRSLDVSIRNAIREIKTVNKRPKAGGHYLSQEELVETLEKAYLIALGRASLEVEEGRYKPEELEGMIEREEIIDRALALNSTRS